MKFEMPAELSSIIKVVGVGGGGSNAVNHMYAQGIRGVDFIICNTDKQALDMSPIPVKLQLGAALTEGLGAGSIPERGNAAAQENLDEIRQLLSTRTKMLFVTAGMGGGTGTGAAPVIARIARDMGILTVGIVTMPFMWEGRKRKLQASSGIEEMRQAVDTLLVINNDRLRDLYGNLTMDDAFGHADNVLTTAARGIAEIITKTGKVNVDFEDVRTVMTNSGVAIMGMAEAEGEDRALRAAQEALASPLLNDNDIKGAKYVLLNVALGDRTISMDEMTEITDHIQDAAGSSADVIWGYCSDENLGDRIRVTVIATGFNQNELTGTLEQKPAQRKVIPLDSELPTMITAPIVNPVTGASVAPKAQPPVAAEPPAEPYIKTVAPTPAPAPMEEQKRIEFEVEAPRARVEVPPPAPVEKKVFDLYEAPAEQPPVATAAPQPFAQAAPSAQPSAAAAEPPRTSPSPVQHQARVEERLSRMREMSLRLRTPNGLADLEREPAFKRKNIVLNDTPHSTDSNVSRYTLSEETDENGERRVELRRNNPFLHDNVD
ncbi:MAG: cell division protein FtsZ [Bacteroidetes bacterium]|nr:cell division protein FtsZ [Bacteroidota bacterium]